MSKRVLVVDDDACVRVTLAEVLRQEGYSVEAVENGKQALSALQGVPRPDIVLLDVRMPVLDGWEFRVHQRADPDLASIPVIAVSGDGTPQAAAIDADAYMPKPVDLPLLFRTMERILRRDALRRSELAQLAQANRMSALATFAAGLSKEMSDPLSIIQTNLEVVRRELPRRDDPNPAASVPVGSDLRDALEESVEAVERLTTLLGGIRGLMLDREQPVDLVEVARTALEIAEPRFPSGTRIVCDMTPVPSVRAHAGPLVEAVVRLLTNSASAISCMPASSRRIDLSSRSEAGGASLIIQDSGPGISDEARQRVFEPFFTARPGDTSGLDLWMCHRLVSYFRGRVYLDSGENESTRFRLWLPLAA